MGQTQVGYGAEARRRRPMPRVRENIMLAIAGAILINAACLLMTTTKESRDIYATRLLLCVVGSSFIGADIGIRIRDFFKKLRGSARPETPHAEKGDSPDRGGK